MYRWMLIAVAALALASPAGCEQVANSARPTWHQKFDWRAEGFFKDPQVIALCEAIEANDLKEIDRLVAAGADVNAKGKGNMTPLLWAYPDNKLERFKKLLEHGANPNVIFESDFNTRMQGMRPGDSIAHMACRTWFPGYFEAVFENGGDPNLWHREEHETPILLLIYGPAREKKAKLQRLIDLGANVDVNIDNEHTGNATPVRVAASCFGQYDLTLMLLEAGANYTSYRPNSNSKLAHTVAREGGRMPRMTPQQKKDYYKLVKWLEDHGESVEAARADLARWKKWARESKSELIDKEVAERKAREAREKAATEKEKAAKEDSKPKPKNP